jgi:hypothetical protein
MIKQLFCAGCTKDMGTIRDASLRKGLVVYCEGCNKMLQSVTDQPISDLYKSIFKGKYR